ncbi:MAG: hypothetical protein VYA55_19230 [Pseudomonadota bacterium]|nr:hypothetical protein [Pseudomonadota bacterium]
MAAVKRLWVILAVVLTACAHAQSTPQVASIHDVSLQLVLSGNKCSLHYQGMQLDLGIEEKCFFLADEQGKPIAKYYDDIGASVVIVAGGRLDLSEYQQPPEFAQPEACGQQSKGLIVSKSGEVSLSPFSSSSMIFCPDSKADEKVYWLFGHKRP